jgi:hypothetical protein
VVLAILKGRPERYQSRAMSLPSPVAGIADIVTSIFIVESSLLNFYNAQPQTPCHGEVNGMGDFSERLLRALSGSPP